MAKTAKKGVKNIKTTESAGISRNAAQTTNIVEILNSELRPAHLSGELKLRAFTSGEATVAAEMAFPVSIDVDAVRLSPRFRFFDFGARPRARECVQH